MQPERLEILYTSLAEALGRVGEDKAALMLATLSLDLVAHCCRADDDADFAAAAIARAERLASV